MKKLFILSILALLISPVIAAAQAHEYSPLVEKTVNYENWELPNVVTEKPEDLRKLMAIAFSLGAGLTLSYER